MPAVKKTSFSARNLWSGLLFGIGLAAFIDEAVFHQLLHWHHFYDRSTTSIGLVSDGFFHAFGWFATVAGLFLFADLRRNKGLQRLRWWSGILLGSGGFHLYDGIIHHKLLRIHQVRYVENVFIYDLVWNAAALPLILAGILLVHRTSSEPHSGKGREK